MKFFYCFFVALALPALALAQGVSKLTYEIHRLTQGGPPAIRVEVTVEGDLPWACTLNLPARFAQVSFLDQVKNVQLQSPGTGFRLGDSFFVLAPEAKQMRLSYEIHQKPGDPRDNEETIVSQTLIHATGYGLLAIPSSLGDWDEVDFELSWHGFPSDWNLMTFAGDGPRVSFRAPVKGALHALYLAGQTRVHPIGTAEQPVRVSLYGQFDIPDDRILAMLEHIIATQRNFWKDFDFPSYLISLIEDTPEQVLTPSSIEGEPARTLLVSGGTGHAHNKSFAASLSKNTLELGFYTLLAHEHFHNWLGLKMDVEGHQDGSNDWKWFSEGFNEYASRVIAFRSCGLSASAFFEECNRQLLFYYTSPVINASNATLARNFWNDGDLNELPYLRGFVFAFYLNHLIKQRNPDQCLDKVFLDLFAIKKGRLFSPEDFVCVVNRSVSEDIQPLLHRVITQGETLHLDALLDILPLEKVRSELGPDLPSLEVFKFKDAFSLEDLTQQVLPFFGPPVLPIAEQPVWLYAPVAGEPPAGRDAPLHP